MTTIKINSNILLNCSSEKAVNQIISANRFDNPVFKNNELNNRSNWDTETYIETFSHENGNLILPRGFMHELLEILSKNGIKPEIIDNRYRFPVDFIDRLYGIELRPYQKLCLNSALSSEQGVIVAPTGSGKSIMGLEIIRRLGQKSLILVHRTDLATQWVDMIRKILGLKAGFIGAGKWEIGEEITVALIQSLASKEEEVQDLPFGLILLDEVHHAPARSFFNVLRWLDAKYRYGLSATPTRNDGLEQMIYRAVGPQISKTERFEVEKIGATVPARVKLVSTGFTPSNCHSWQDYLSDLSTDASRNLLIIDLVKQQRSPTLILVDRVAHAENLSSMFSKRDIDHVLAHSQVKDRKWLMDKIRSSNITIGTTGLLGEGLDVSSWTVLILGSPISSEIKLLQAVGRVIRSAPGKESALIFDLKDDCGFAGSSFKKRFEIYKKHRIWVEFDQSRAA